MENLSTRQYVGARYVPKLMGEWDKNISYENLVIVTYKGNSFTSKQPVPQGVDISNTDYWVNTGNYNLQIEEYRKEVNKFTTTITEEFEALKTNLMHDINSINSPNLKNMSERKFVFVGDSYTQIPTPTTSFVGKCVKMLGLNDNQYHNIGVSGVDMTGFIAEIENYNYNDTEKITDVVVTGGINDAHIYFLDSNLDTTIPLLISKITTKFPNATIWAGWSGGGYYTNPTLTADYPNFNYKNVQGIKYLWEKNFNNSNKVIYMDKLDEWQRLLNDTDIYIGGSGLHPIGFGSDILARKISNYLKGGSVLTENLTQDSTVNMTLALSATLETNGGPIVVNMNKPYEELYIPWRGVNLNGTITLSAADTLLFKYTLTSTEVTSVANNTTTVVSAPVTYCLASAPTTFIVAMANYKFTGTNIYISIPNAVAPINNISSIWTPDLRFLVPANAI